MPTLPTTVKYSADQYSYSVTPDIVRSEFSTRNTRQRKRSENRDDIFSVSFDLSNSQLQDWEDFVIDEIDNGGDLFTAPFYTSDVENSGSFYLVGGQYDVSYISNNSWSVQCRLELKDRTLTEEQNIYELIEDYGTFPAMYSVLDALEDMANNSNL